MVEGEYVFNEAINYLNTLPYLKPLQWDESLALSALEHVMDIGPKGLLSYQSSDGTEPEERILKYGNYSESLGENIDFGPNDTMGVIISLTLDDGEEDRPHRENLFKADYQKVGIACGPHKTEYQMCVMDFAFDFEGFHEEQNEYRKNFQNQEKTSPELGSRHLGEVSMLSEKAVDKKNSVKNVETVTSSKDSVKLLDPLANANYGLQNQNKNQSKNVMSNSNAYEETFGNRSMKNIEQLTSASALISSNFSNNVKTQANTHSLNNNQSPLVRLSIDKEENKQSQRVHTESEIENLSEMVKTMNISKRVVSKHVEVTTKIVYTFEDGSTKEVIEKQNHTFPMHNN
jgi:hypothetical protein